MGTKSEIVDICRSLADGYEDWNFTAGAFKNVQSKHTIKLIDPLWSFSPGSALTSPVAGVFHKQIEKLHKKIFGFSSYWTHRVQFKKYYDDYSGGGLRIRDIVEDDAENCVQKIIDQGLYLLDRTYNFDSEEDLLENIPEEVEGSDGVKYCLIRAYLGDIDYVSRYRNDEIETQRPKKLESIDKIIKEFRASV